MTMSQSSPSESPLPREAYTLLAQANLLRVRGRWDEAVEACMAALRLAPDNASAQSLLGDIYENQGRCDDAIQWYRMALDVNPDSPADKIKLQRLLDADPRRWTETPATGTVIVSRPSPVTTHTQGGTDADRLLRGVVWLTAALFLVAIALGGLVMSRHRAMPSTITTSPVVVPPPPTDPANESVSSGVSAGPGTPALASGTSPAPVPPAPAAADPSEQALLQTLQQDTTLSSQNLSPVGVQVDPRQSVVTVTLLCPAPPTGASVREVLLRDAVLTALAGERAESSGVSVWTIRCLLSPPAGTASTTPDLALVADITPTALSALGSNPAALPAAQILPAFHNVWWSSAVAQ